VFKANRYISAKYNRVIFHSEMTTGSGLQRPSAGQHYKNSKITFNTVKIKLVSWDLTWLTKFI